MSDFEAVHAYSSDPRVTRYLFFGPRDEESTTEYLEGLLASQSERPRTRFELAVEESASMRVIGACDLSFVERNVVDLGYMLAAPHWGKGFATEIATALIEAAFRDLRARSRHLDGRRQQRRINTRAGENRHALGGRVPQAPPRQEPLVGLPPLRPAARGVGSGTLVLVVLALARALRGALQHSVVRHACAAAVSQGQEAADQCTGH